MGREPQCSEILHILELAAGVWGGDGVIDGGSMCSLGSLRVFVGLSLDVHWVVVGFSLDSRWTLVVCLLDARWMFVGFSLYRRWTLGHVVM